MNIVSSGTSYQVYDESVNTFKKLPVGCYTIEFSPMSGFSLKQKSILSFSEDKIYGNTEYNVNKVIKSYQLSDRNFGIILSGEKGTGKSLFAKVLANKVTELGYPIIVASCNYPGLADFISSIEQECVVLFDEFEKNFPCDYESDYDDNTVGAEGGVQNNLLSLFDGIDNGKKLFVITCNDTYKLSEFFLNRPGRFHYHFEILPPNPEEIKEYLTDKLDSKYTNIIEEVIHLSLCGSITYDCLRAIAFEINQGYSFTEVINSLNITRDKRIQLDFEIILDNGTTFVGTDSVDLFRNRYEELYMYNTTGDDINIRYVPSDIVFNTDGFSISPDKLNISRCYIRGQEENSKKVTIKSVKITKSLTSYMYRYMV